MKRTQRTAQAVRETVIPEAIEPREARELSADGHTFNVVEANTEEPQHRSGSEGLPGSKGVACAESHGGNPGGPVSSRPTGRVDRYNRKEGRSTGYRESDTSIVLGARESRVHASAPLRRCRHGEGTYGHAQPSQETSAGKSRPDRLMPTTLRGIARIAKRSKTYRFRSLYSLLNRTNLLAEFGRLNRKAAAGADGVTYAEYARDAESHVDDMVRRLKEKRYRAGLVRRVLIPKGNGKTRPLGVPAISDKVVQSAGARVLESIYEQDFLDCSYGFRPGRGVRDAVQSLRGELSNRYTWVVEADIKGFFDNIDHDWMVRMLEQRVNDKAFLRLIRKWLKAGVLDTDKHVIHPATGTPQGGVISPVLANVYLHYSLDLWFEKVVKPRCRGEAFLVRYADDFVAAFRYHGDAQRFYRALPKRLGKFGLSLAEDKTGVKLFTRFRKRDSGRFDFLGFEFRWGRSRSGADIIRQRTSRDKLRKSVHAVADWLRENRNLRLRRVFADLSVKLRGYYQFYGVSGNHASLKAFYTEVIRRMYYWLNRRSDRRSFNWKTFSEIERYYGLHTPRIVWGNDRQQKLLMA